ncbi:MAG: molybdate ABC transporter substrate-binding protein [Nitrospiraceae bacterium]|nr:MAG: molybdate ABC transporter substrate-binding protein [Nitrospiraceae bacterium]
MKKISLLLLSALLNVLSLPLSAFAVSPNEITVSAAADLSSAFREIAAMFEKETGVKALLNFGSTGMLAQQIEGGAPIDMFAAAQKSFIDDLEKRGFILPDTKRIYAIGRIALAVPRGAAKLDSLKGLLRPEIKKIAIANPAHAPYGMAAKAALERMGLWEKVRDKMVYGENVRQALSYVETGSVDAAIVALSISIGSDINYTLVPQELHPPLEQTLAVTKGGRNPGQARKFAEFINGPKGRPIMKKFGFLLPPEMK